MSEEELKRQFAKCVLFVDGILDDAMSTSADFLREVFVKGRKFFLEELVCVF